MNLNIVKDIGHCDHQRFHTVNVFMLVFVILITYL